MLGMRILLLLLVNIWYVRCQSYDECEQSLAGMNNDTQLLCDGLGWESFPSAQIPQDVVHLSVSRNNIKSIPDDLSSDELLSLTLDDNQITHVEARHLKNMPNLAALSMRNNKVASINADLLKNLNQFSVLVLDGNELQEVPETLLPNKHCNYLGLAKNRIKAIPEGLLQGQSKLWTLTLADNELEELGEATFDGVTGMNKLDLQNNKLKKLPENMGKQLIKLRHLNVANNSLKDFPWDSFLGRGFVDYLLTLDISSNEISSIPYNFAQESYVANFAFYDNPLQCTCEMDWLRKKFHNFVGLDNLKYAKELRTAYFTPVKYNSVKCTGPEAYVGKRPHEVPTFCDVDECLGERPCVKRSVCRNTPGDYECRCIEGYHGNGKYECIDINECLRGLNPYCDPGNSFCTNTLGSYYCTCSPGYFDANEAQTNCTDINECKNGTHDCPHGATCINIPGTYKCQCPAGHEVVYHRCVDIDECKGEHGCEKACYNTIGSYLCNCRLGFFYGTDKNCHDVNECDGENECDQYADCMNNHGSYDCQCRQGFTGDGRNCKDINECADYTDNCHDNATCINTIGSHKCECHKGLVGDGVMFCGTQAMHQKYLQTIAAQKRLVANMDSSSSTTIIIIVVALLAVIAAVIGAMFYLKPNCIFKLRGRYEAVRKLDDETTLPLTSEDDKEDN